MPRCIGMLGNLADTRETCQRSPGQNRREVQGSVPNVPTQSSFGVASLCSPPLSRPGHQAASWRPVVSTDSPRRFSTTECGPVASGGAPGGPHSVSSPRSGPALPARSLEAQTLTSPPRWWSSLRLPCAYCHLGGRAQGCRCGPLGARLTPPALAARALLPPDDGQLPHPTPTPRRATLHSGPLL